MNMDLTTAVDLLSGLAVIGGIGWAMVQALKRHRPIPIRVRQRRLRCCAKKRNDQYDRREATSNAFLNRGKEFLVSLRGSGKAHPAHVITGTCRLLQLPAG